MEIDKRTLILTGAGLIVGFAEGLLFYNLAKYEKEGANGMYFPKGAELAKMIGLVMLTSVATTALSNGLESWLVQVPDLPELQLA